MNKWKLAFIVLVSLLVLKGVNDMIVKIERQRVIQKALDRAEAQTISYRKRCLKEGDMSTPKLILTRLKRFIND